MPNVHVALPETEQSIFRPVVIAIVKNVQEITKMKDSQIYFPDEDKKNATAGGTIDTKEKVDRYVETTSKRMNQITVEEEVDRDEISPTFFTGKEYTPVFQDKYLGLVISPVYAKHQVTISFNYSCGGKTEAQRWLQDMRMAISRLRDLNVHTVEYQYNLDRRLMGLVKLIYGMREQQGGYGQTFDQYWKANSTPRLTYIGDLVGDQAIMAVAERQTEIYGQFEFEGLPSKPVKDEESGLYIVAFEYKFNYDKPIGCHMKYPVIVHNQTLPLEYIAFTSDEVRPADKTVLDGSRSQMAFRLFRADFQMDRVKAEDGIIVVPRFDDFTPNVVLRFTAGMVQVLNELDPTDLRNLLSLQNLGDVVLDSDVLEFLLTSEYSYLAQPYKSIFNVGLYCNNILQDFRSISVDSALNITSTSDLDIRNQYRIRLSVVTDIDFVEQAAIARLRRYPKVVFKIVSAINRAFRENPEMTAFSNLNRLSELEFNAIYRGLLGKEPLNGNTQIGWGISNILSKNGITDKTLHRIQTQGRTQRRTMILGTLAFSKHHPELESAQAGHLEIPLQTTANY